MTPFHGHTSAVTAFTDGLATQRLHHAWLLAGPQGVGKGLFARKAALRLLAEASGSTFDASGLEVPNDHPTAQLFASETHPDFRLVEREVWAGTSPNEYIVPKSERSASEQPARGIRIKQVRMLAPFFNVRPTFSDRRVIVVDSIDEFEGGASQALLKMLEEPPLGTLFLLVSHAPDRLLPTIRSRCRTVRFSLLADDVMTAALRDAIPDAEEAEIAELAAAGQGSPGRALAFRGLDIAALDKAMRNLVAKGDPTNARRARLAQSLALKAAQPRYEAFLARIPSLIAAEAKTRTGRARAEALQLWEKTSDLADNATRLSLEPQSVVFGLSGMLAALAPRQR